MNKVDAFFYGLYMDANLLKSMGFHPTSVQTACIDSYRLDLNGLAKIVPDEKECVWGKLMCLPEDELKAMYSYESTLAYIPVELEAKTEGGQVLKAACYIAPQSEDLPFNTEYLRKLLRVVRNEKLPLAYQQKLEQLLEH